MWALFMIRNVKKQRPVNLDLQTIRFPITAIASILHRVSGVAYHAVMGIRHLLMDFGYIEETLEAGTRSAKICFVIIVVLSLLAGVLVW
ncbi:MAG: hypothetical protein E7D17_07265 [Citrobacter freundii]|nr:hypothetical protein [Citrobacter freundii]